jgi:hypothetical protein
LGQDFCRFVIDGVALAKDLPPYLALSRLEGRWWPGAVGRFGSRGVHHEDADVLAQDLHSV